MNTMTYKGYAARIEYDDNDGIFVGRLLGIRDIVVFHGETVQGLRKALRDTVEGYIETCRKAGIEPQRPASGKFSLRMPPEVHSAAMAAAEADGTSLNQFVTRLIAERTMQARP